MLLSDDFSLPTAKNTAIKVENRATKHANSAMKTGFTLKFYSEIPDSICHLTRRYPMAQQVTEIKKAPLREPSYICTGQHAFLAAPCGATTSADAELNCCVRNGNRCFLRSMVTRKPVQVLTKSKPFESCTLVEKYIEQLSKSCDNQALGQLVSLTLIHYWTHSRDLSNS